MRLCNLFQTQKIPDNHTERFRIMEAHFQPFYVILNKMFPVYQQTYRSDISEEQLEALKNGLQKIKGLAGLE